MGGNGMKQIPEELRPTCSCGEKMIVEKYRGYYDEFSYFSCTNCELDADDYEPDDDWVGSYS